MGFKAEDKHISEILKDTIFLIPRNQRRYVWQKKHWQDLINDIISIASANIKGEKISHFIGSIVLQDSGKNNNIQSYTVIDGQQRITTVVIILSSLMKLYHERGMKANYEGLVAFLQSSDINSAKKPVIASEYHQSLKVIVDSVSNLSFSDSPQEVTKFIKDQIISSKDKLIEDCFMFFYNEINKYSTDDNNLLLSFRDALININIVRIVSTSEEDAYTIFEILNARGQELEDHELIKNYIMRYIHPETNRDDAKVTWEDIERDMHKYMSKFIKHYTIHLFRTKLHDKEKDTDYRIIRQNRKFNETQLLLKDLRRKSLFYKRVVDPEKGEELHQCSNLEYKVFSFFKSKKQEQYRPLLLSLINKKESGEMSQVLYNKTITTLYQFFICYTLIGEEQSNKLIDTVYKYSKLFEHNYSDILVDEFIASLRQKAPNFTAFKSIFCNIGWSNHHSYYNDEKKKRRVKMVLEIMEKEISGREFIDEFSIEHMLNDSESIDNARIGNLIPLEENLNGRCKNNSFNEKLPIYRESNFKIARNISEKYENGIIDVNKRSEYLAKKIYTDILGFSIN